MKKYLGVFSFLFSIFIVLLFYFTKLNTLKIYPCTVNFSIFLLFFLSLFQDETVIQKIAKIKEGNLKEPIKTYTRNLTYVWVVFLFFQFVVSIVTCFLSDNIFMFYNGCISYVLLGCFFGAEYIFRIFYKKKYGLL